jgi:biopolymer transport protein ExbD
MRIAPSATTGGPARYKLSLIALIDVVLFLLLYFMVAGTLAPEEKNLPSTLEAERGTGRGAAVDMQPQVVKVVPGADGTPEFQIGARAIRDKAELTRVLKALPKDGGVFVKTSGRVRVEAAAAALQACRDAGFVRVTYVPAG